MKKKLIKKNQKQKKQNTILINSVCEKRDMKNGFFLVYS